ncbi:MAG TPA: AAA family ATPase, partial [Candidatus Nanoarchaeia archaeon]|nr:AAA family ATPase [Candidatus Nanoarchaeia archaeon]
MYKSFEIKNFKCFKHFLIKDLDRINIITGLNNAGKTALLEALFVHFGAYNPNLLLRVLSYRGIGQGQLSITKWEEMPWTSYFHKFDFSKSIFLSGQLNTGFERNILIKELKEPEELLKISQMKKKGYPDDALFSSSAEAIQVLGFKYNENGNEGIYYLILWPEGLEVFPFVPSPPKPAFFLNERSRLVSDAADLYSKLEINKQDILLK